MKNYIARLRLQTLILLSVTELVLPGFGQANSETWVDFNYASTPSMDGTFLFPFNTFGEGLNDVRPGGTLWIKTGTSPETASTAKPMTLRAYNGPVTIGRTLELSGWVDMHTHPMSHLGFGSRILHGAPDVGSIIPAGTRPFGTACIATNFRATSIEEALGNCKAAHAGWGIDNSCGDHLRAFVLNNLFDKDFVYRVSGNAIGDHEHAGIESSHTNFLYWPHQSSKTHQQMWYDWIRRAHDEGGLRVMVALAVNNELLAEAVNGSEPKDDKSSADLQVDEIISFVGRHPDFMEIAYTAADLRRIVGANRLAVIVGMEVDNIGNFNKLGMAASECAIRDEIERLYGKGVRYVFPIHLVDNAFGGTAVYDDLFNYANKYSTSLRAGGIEIAPGGLYAITTSADPLVTFRLGSGTDFVGNLGFTALLLGLSGTPYPPAFPCPILGCYPPFMLVSTLLQPDPSYATYALSRLHAVEKVPPIGD